MKTKGQNPRQVQMQWTMVWFWGHYLYFVLTYGTQRGVETNFRDASIKTENSLYFTLLFNHQQDNGEENEILY